MAEFSKWGDRWVRLGHLPKGVVVEGQLAAQEPWPGDVVPREPLLKRCTPERLAVVHVVVPVDVFHERLLEPIPLAP